MATVVGKARLPGLHQAHLADGGGSLQLMHRAGSRRPAQAAHTGGHSPGRNQYQLDASLMQGHHLLDPHRHCLAIQALAICRQQCAADLHDPALRTRHLAPHHLQPLPANGATQRRPWDYSYLRFTDTKTPLE
ncbi:hypothetical protein D3C78_1460330 [compost metagenome]